MAHLLVAAVFIITLVDTPHRSGGVVWDFANALGYLGLAGLLYLFIDVGFSRRHRIHHLLSYLFVSAITVHVLWLWIGQNAVWHYLSLQAPHYMFAGAMSFVLLIGMIVLALPMTRRHWHLSHPNFQIWHYYLSLCVISTGIWHVGGSGFYVSMKGTIALGTLSVIVLACHRFKLLPVSNLGFPAFWSVVIWPVVFVAVKWAGGPGLPG